MSDKWIDAETFSNRVEEVYDKLLQRWDNVHDCDVVHGFFYCCDDEDHKGYRSDMRIRVCDGCGDDLYPNSLESNRFFHCNECEFTYNKTGEIE
tara:strand:- start:99 stop:380 length:282 start_codon:yes stop_codon:yes gene_type:complete